MAANLNHKKSTGRRRSTASQNAGTNNTTNHTTSREHHHHRRHRQSHHTRMVGALDHPLPIASAINGVWTPRRKIHRTLRRIATLATKAGAAVATATVASEMREGNLDPIVLDNASGAKLCIAGDEYIVVGNTTASSLYIFRLSSSSILAPLSSTSQPSATDPLVSPWAVISLQEDDSEEEEEDPKDSSSDNNTSNNIPNSIGRIVSIKALPFGQSLIYGETIREEEGHVVLFTDDGRCIIVRIRKNDSGRSFHSRNRQK